MRFASTSLRFLQPVDRRADRLLVVRARHELLQPQRLADARRVDEERGDAARGELQARAQEPELLRRIEAADEDRGRAARLPMPGRNTRAASCLRTAPARARPDGCDASRPRSNVRSTSRYDASRSGDRRRDEVLGDRVVQAREKVVLRRGVARPGLRPLLEDPRRGAPIRDARLRRRPTLLASCFSISAKSPSWPPAANASSVLYDQR